MIDKKQIENEISNVLNNLSKEYLQTEGLILTEDDLKIHLFMKLYQSDFFRSIRLGEMSNSTLTTSFLHSEISFYNENRKLIFKPDIVLFTSTNSLRINNDASFNFNNGSLFLENDRTTKGYAFTSHDGLYIFELKFCRDKKFFDEKIKSCYLDSIKINRLQIINGVDNIRGFVIFFCTERSLNSRFEKLTKIKASIKEYKNIEFHTNIKLNEN